MSYLIEIADRQASLRFDAERLRQGVARVLSDAGVARATISLAIVDDPTIHAVNRDFLDHDYPTDVISFVLEHDAGGLEGEIIASADTARAEAKRLDWPAEDELLLYVVHGALHLVGHDDLDPVDRAAMRQRETEVLATLGVQARYES